MKERHTERKNTLLIQYSLCFSAILVLFSCGGKNTPPPKTNDDMIVKEEADVVDPLPNPLCKVSEHAPPTSGSNFGLEHRVSPECVTLSADTTQSSDIVAMDAFPSLRFNRPVDFALMPGTNNIIVVEHNGILRLFKNSPDAKESTVFLDIRTQVNYDRNEQGLVNIAFDPKFESNGYFYVTYNGLEEHFPDECQPDCSIISRFRVDENTPSIADLASEQVVLAIPLPYSVHNANNLVFGPDGYLYIGVGDGGFFGHVGDPQNRTNVLGSVLRIDVSHGLPYSIPADNPFVQDAIEFEGVVGEGEQIAQEIWAFGFRNPHRFSFDNPSGEMWLADVGAERQEELNIVEAGKNYGWNIFEGTLKHSSYKGERSEKNMVPPIHTYDHTVGKSVIGGHVYRGQLFPELFGSYIYGDFVAGVIWSLQKDAQNNVVSNTELTLTGGFSITSFTPINNELFFTNLSQNSIQHLVRSTNMGTPAPTKLSETGIFLYLDPIIVSPGVIPYDINAPLWSDGTVKSRWFILPDNTEIDRSKGDTWEFPLGSVFVKHFAMDTDTTNKEDPFLNLETRILINTHEGWKGYTYRWDDDQSDATLLQRNAWQDIATTSETGNETIRYYYPSGSDCLVCHNATDSYVIGVRAAQLNREFKYQNATDNQLRALTHIGVLSATADESKDSHTYASLDDDSFPVEHRARSYLASNCAHCHNIDNTLPTDLDLRYTDPLKEMHGIGSEPIDKLGITDAKIITPGNKEKSILWLRINTTDETRMPPLATHKIDQLAVDLIGEWIDSMRDLSM